MLEVPIALESSRWKVVIVAFALRIASHTCELSPVRSIGDNEILRVNIMGMSRLIKPFISAY